MKLVQSKIISYCVLNFAMLMPAYSFAQLTCKDVFLTKTLAFKIGSKDSGVLVLPKGNYEVKLNEKDRGTSYFVYSIIDLNSRQSKVDISVYDERLYTPLSGEGVGFPVLGVEDAIINTAAKYFKTSNGGKRLPMGHMLDIFHDAFKSYVSSGGDIEIEYVKAKRRDEWIQGEKQPLIEEETRARKVFYRFTDSFIEKVLKTSLARVRKIYFYPRPLGAGFSEALIVENGNINVLSMDMKIAVPGWPKQMSLADYIVIKLNPQLLVEINSSDTNTSKNYEALLNFASSLNNFIQNNPNHDINWFELKTSKAEMQKFVSLLARILPAIDTM